MFSPKNREFDKLPLMVHPCMYVRKEQSQVTATEKNNRQASQKKSPYSSTQNKVAVQLKRIFLCKKRVEALKKIEK